MLYFNEGFAILLINANFYGYPRFSGIFNGAHPDFDRAWFIEVAPFIIYPMIIQIIYPAQIFLPDFIIQQ